VSIANEPAREIVGRIEVRQHNLIKSTGLACPALLFHAGTRFSILQTAYQLILFPLIDGHCGGEAAFIWGWREYRAGIGSLDK
jgi:hypothetical protein